MRTGASDRLPGPDWYSVKAGELVRREGCLQLHAPAVDFAAVTRHGTRHRTDAGALLGIHRSAVCAAVVAGRICGDAGAPGSSRNGRCSGAAMARGDRAYARSAGRAGSRSCIADPAAAIPCSKSRARSGESCLQPGASTTSLTMFVTNRDSCYWRVWHLILPGLILADRLPTKIRAQR